LASVAWENKFLLVTVQALTRAGSDRTPLLLDPGEQPHIGNKATFSFELSWLRQERFMELVTRVWNSTKSKDKPLETLQSKIRHVRSFLRGWAKKLSSVYKKEEERLLNNIDILDKRANTSPLKKDECHNLRIANESLAKLRGDEETKWAQRVEVTNVQEGGNNTKYFHMIMNEKHRRKKNF
jgi:hypothetical protein